VANYVEQMDHQPIINDLATFEGQKLGAILTIKRSTSPAELTMNPNFK
jgi:hypothetical protein